MRHLPPTATPIEWKMLRAAFAGQPADVTRFRSALEGYLGVHACFLAASGRTALYMLLQTLRDETPDPERREVVLPAYTCPSVAKVVIDARLRPRFVDVGPFTLSYNMTELATAVSQRTLAVILVHPFGIPQAVEPVLQIARNQDALVIEDAAQSMGARVGNRHAGTLTDFGLFSLGPGKPMSTGGGGFVCTASEAAAELLRRAWADLGAVSGFGSALAAMRLALFRTAFHPTGWWLASRMGALRAGENESSWGYSLHGLSPAQAAAGLTLLPCLDALNAARRRRGEQLAAALSGMRGVHLPGRASIGDAGKRTSDTSAVWSYLEETGETTFAASGNDVEPIYLRFPLVFESEESRERAVRSLNEAGIGAGRMYRKPLAALFPAYADGVYPGAEHVSHCLLTLPTHHYVTDEDVARMVEVLGSIVGSGREQQGYADPPV